MAAAALTALPIIETQAGDVSAYIPTNVISITDGQIFLETDLFYQPVSAPPSTSAFRSVARRLGRADQGDEEGRQAASSSSLPSIARWPRSRSSAADLDASTQRLLARGARLTELLKQPQFNPMPFEEQTASIFAGTNGYLDKVKVEDVVRYEAAMIADLRANHADVLTMIRDSRDLGDEAKGKLKGALDSFAKTFA